MTLLRSCSTVRVRYAETDQMGVAYHGDYFAWFEVGRTDLLRQLGMTYKQLEAEDVRLRRSETPTLSSQLDEEGVSLLRPLIETRVQFRKPALYDDVLEIRTRLVEMTGVRLTFEYDVVKSGEDEALAQAMTAHAAVDGKGRPRRLRRSETPTLSSQPDEEGVSLLRPDELRRRLQ